MPDLVAFARRHRRSVAAGAAFSLLALGLAALAHLAREVRLTDVRAVFHALPARRVAAALALTAGSYLLLTLYDVLALRIIGRPLPWRTAAFASFTSYTLSHNLGLAPVTGGSARYRVYAAAGLDGADVARVVAIAGCTFWMGVAAVSGAALLLHPGALALGDLVLPEAAARASGAAVLASAAAVALLCAFGPRELSLFGWRLPLPSGGQAVAQILLATLDLTAASAALFVLIPGLGLSWLPAFVLAYSLAIVAGLVTHVPGGVGVFEAVVMAVLPTDRTALLAALIAYRVIYYLLPLAVAVALIAWREAGRPGRARLAWAGLRGVAVELAPAALSAACFLGGVVLLVSGSLPAIPGRLRFLAQLAPLPFVEASHVAASLAGTGLLLLAPGLYRRLDGAFLGARALLLAGAAFSLLKGLDYEEAAVCMGVAALLQWTRPAFYRGTALTQQPFSPRWLLLAASVVLLSVWVGFFSYKHVPYRDDLWWRVAIEGDASRFLRASLAAGVLLGAAAVSRLLAPAPARPGPPGPEDWADVERLVADADRTDATLAWTGDKRFLFSAARDAFLMFQVRGATWVVIGDPVGDPAAWPELLWAARTMADAAQGRLLLYQIGPRTLEHAIGMGLEIVKYGEEAVIDLAGFDLGAPRLRSARKAGRRAERMGARFEVAPAAIVPALLPELRAVSDEWVALKRHREKSFSLGRFDPVYLRRFDQALVRVEGRVVAFANIWATANRREVSVDLMRHAADAPPGVMDFLFVHLIGWSRAQGFERFNLGLAPLSGIEGRRLAPAWARLARLVFRHGERLYGFQGLRTYKEKFAPDWEPRYVAGPRGVALLRALRDLAALINGAAPAPVPDAPARRCATGAPAAPGLAV